ncbi:thioredoxin family protein [Zobellella maritima]|uniref:thioredoxin family protein n=1 Tax=Zobellella maritima TaxID=2059725 RepID=UPI0018E539C9|nr:thioredoxin family protein [Zobellella maritima]
MTLLKTLLCAVALLVGAEAMAAGIQPFSQQAFARLQTDKAAVLVEVYADWCAVCQRQEAVLTPMLAEPEFAHITLLKLDFDRQKEALRTLGVNRQSTLILFDGGEEIARVLGDTSPERLRAFLGQLR